MIVSPLQETVDELFGRAFTQHQANQTEVARKLYDQVLERDPNHALAIHSLGVIALVERRHRDAIALFERAIEIKGNEAAFYHNLARAVQGEGQLSEAVQWLRRSVEINPEFSGAWQTLAEIYYALDNTDEAARAIGKVAELQTKTAESYNKQGIALVKQNRLKEAASAFRAGIACKPTGAAIYYNAGNVLTTLGSYHDAILCLTQASKLEPASTPIYISLSNAQYRSGDLGAALDSRAYAWRLDSKLPQKIFEVSTSPALVRPQKIELSQLEPDFQALAFECLNRGLLEEALQRADECVASGRETARLQNLRGNVLDRMKLTSRSIVAYERAVFLDQDMAIARCNLGLAYQQAGDIDRAILTWEALISITPSFTDAYVALALTRMERQEFNDAEKLLRQALSVDPRCAAAHVNLGLVFQRLERLSEARDCYRKALRCDSSLATAHVNLGALYHRQGLSFHACKHFRKALKFEPNLAVAQHNLAQELLLRGDFDEGWRLYESRFVWLEERGAPPTKFSAPRWYGDDPSGKTILLVAEQGLGDSMQFIRYASLLAARGARVLVQAQQQVANLLRTVDGVSAVFSRGAPLPKFDAYCPLMSLPLAFKTTLTSIPNNVPYVHAVPERIVQWQQRLGDHQNLRVGLCWAGSPRDFDYSLAQTDRRRSIPISKLRPLFDVPGVHIYSLQKVAPDTGSEADVLALTRIAKYPSDLNNFADDAAYVENLDLVISVDTSVVHLAGALGKPVWVLLRFDGCWRWLTHRDDSRWYPTARLWRQESPGDWSGVVSRVRAALVQLAAIRRSASTVSATR